MMKMIIPWMFFVVLISMECSAFRQYHLARQKYHPTRTFGSYGKSLQGTRSRFNPISFRRLRDSEEGSNESLSNQEESYEKSEPQSVGTSNNFEPIPTPDFGVNRGSIPNQNLRPAESFIPENTFKQREPLIPQNNNFDQNFQNNLNFSPKIGLGQLNQNIDQQGNSQRISQPNTGIFEDPNDVIKNRGTFISELPNFPVPNRAIQFDLNQSPGIQTSSRFSDSSLSSNVPLNTNRVQENIINSNQPKDVNSQLLSLLRNPEPAKASGLITVGKRAQEIFGPQFK